jgi:acyl carrier protein
MNDNKVANTVHDQIYDLISMGLKIDKDKIHLESRFIDDLGADSLDQVELVMALEESFEIDIPEDDAEKFATVNDIIEYIALKKTVN